MKVLLTAAALALGISSSASAATLFKVHAEGTATGHLASLGIIYPNPEPITVDATFDLSKGARTTNAAVDRIDGPDFGTGDVDLFSFGSLATTDWGDDYAALNFLDAVTTSTFSFTLLDPTNDRILYLIVNRMGNQFTSLDDLPTGEVCSGANACFGGIVGFDGSTTGNNLEIAWSAVTLSMENTAVPEPSTWALMILGFGAAGTMLRRRIPQTAA